MVSLVGRPSARASQLYAVARFDGATDEVIAAVERGEPPKDLQRVDVAIRSVDREARIVRGLVYNPPWDPEQGAVVSREEFERHVDSHGTFMTPDDLRHAAHRFIAVSRGIDVNHNKVAGAGTVIESMIVRSGGEGWPSPEGILPEGAWVMACKVEDDEVWNRVLRGQDDPNAEDGLTGYSVYLYVQFEDRAVEVDEPDPQATQRGQSSPPTEHPSALAGDKSPKPSGPLADPAGAISNDVTEETVGHTILQALRGLFGVRRAPEAPAAVPAALPEAVEPEAVERMERWSDWSQVWPLVSANAQLGELFWALRMVVYSILDDDEVEDKPAAFGRTFDAARAQLIDLYQTLKAAGAARSAPVEDPLDLEAALRVVQASQHPLSDSALSEARAQAKALTTTILAARGEGDPTMTEEQIRSAVQGAITTALAPLSERLDRIERQQTEEPKAEATPAEAAKPAEPDIGAIVRAAVAEGLKPIEDKIAAAESRINRVERGAPAPSALDNDGSPATRADADYNSALMGL